MQNRSKSTIIELTSAFTRDSGGSYIPIYNIKGIGYARTENQMQAKTFITTRQEIVGPKQRKQLYKT